MTGAARQQAEELNRYIRFIQAIEMSYLRITTEESGLYEWARAIRERMERKRD